MTDWKSYTHTLLHPIKVGEQTISSITMREPDVDALDAIEDVGFKVNVEPTVKQLRAAVVALSKEPGEIIGKLHKKDFEVLCEHAVPLLAGSEETKPPTTTTNDGPVIDSTASAPISATG